MHSERQALRRLLSALIDERSDAALLYIPRGEEGMRRMIRALLEMRAPLERDPLADDIARFLQQGQPQNEDRRTQDI